jgi:hypothetical protein
MASPINPAIARGLSRTDANVRQIAKHSEHVQEPKHHADHYYVFRMDFIVPCIGMRFTNQSNTPITISTITI